MEKKNVFVRANESGVSYEKFISDFENEVNSTDISKLNEKEKELFEYKKLNFQRSSRIHKTYKPSEKLLSTLKSIDAKQTWMILTENWCGDSAQNLPYIFEIAKSNQMIELKILYRDENLDIMDLYLTNGKSRSIPKLVAFNEFGEELFQWGPRPNDLIEQIEIWKSEGMTKDEYIKLIHLWYSQNKGRSIENEFIKLLNS